MFIEQRRAKAPAPAGRNDRRDSVESPNACPVACQNEEISTTNKHESRRDKPAAGVSNSCSFVSIRGLVALSTKRIGTARTNIPGTFRPAGAGAFEALML